MIKLFNYALLAQILVGIALNLHYGNNINPNLFNYALMAQFVCCLVFNLYNGNYTKCIYWLGALLCTAGVTFD